LPDKLFRSTYPRRPALDAHRRRGRSVGLPAEIAARDAATNGPTGRARCRPRGDALYDVLDVASKRRRAERSDPGSGPSASPPPRAGSPGRAGWATRLPARARPSGRTMSP